MRRNFYEAVPQRWKARRYWVMNLCKTSESMLSMMIVVALHPSANLIFVFLEMLLNLQSQTHAWHVLTIQIHLLMLLSAIWQHRLIMIWIKHSKASQCVILGVKR